MALEHLASTDGTAPAKRAAKCGYEKLREVQAIFATLSVELQGDKFWRYQQQVSPGLQEYIEALSFANFLENGSLITFDQVQATLSDPDGIPVRLIYDSYSGTYPDLQVDNSIFHCRFLIIFSACQISRGNSCALLYLASHGEVAGKGPVTFVHLFETVKQVGSNFDPLESSCPRRISGKLAYMCLDFERIIPYIWDLKKKQAVTAQSLEKIEDGKTSFTFKYRCFMR